MANFLPACHAFLGTLFVQIKWKLILNQPSENSTTNLFPSLLCLLVKLSGEPNVRQAGKMLSILQESESWNWGYVDSTKYEGKHNIFFYKVRCQIHIYSGSHWSWMFCFAQLLLQVLVNCRSQGQIWKLLVLTFSRHPLHVQFDRVLAEMFGVRDG